MCVECEQLVDFLSVRFICVYACLLCMSLACVCVCLCAVVVYKPIEIDLT